MLVMELIFVMEAQPAFANYVTGTTRLAVALVWLDPCDREKRASISRHNSLLPFHGSV